MLELKLSWYWNCLNCFDIFYLFFSLTSFRRLMKIFTIWTIHTFFDIFFWEITISEIVFDFLLLLTILIIFDNLNNFVWQFWTIITLIDNYANVENVHNSTQFLDLAIQNKMVGSFPYSSFALSLSYVCFHSNWCQKRWRYKFSYTICPSPTKISIHG